MAFQSARKTYENVKSKEHLARSQSEPAYNAAVERTLEALDALARAPAKSIVDVATKLRIVRGEFEGSVPRDEAGHILSDLDRLSGPALDS
jgi:hypothetical protein